MAIEHPYTDLITAHNERRLCAGHIDMQTAWYNRNLATVFDDVSHHAEDMRRLSVPNIWIVNAEGDFVSTVSEFQRMFQSHADFNPEAPEVMDEADAIDPSIKLDPHETVLTKSEAGLFHGKNTVAQDVLKQEGYDTVLLDGLLAYACFQRTVKQSAISGFRTYAVLDLTDCSPEYYESFKSATYADLPDEETRSRLTFATRPQVLNVLNPNGQMA